MNVRRFAAPTAREALVLVREALGDDAVVLSTHPVPNGVEVMALAPEGMVEVEKAAAKAGAGRTNPPTLLQAATPVPVRPATLAERIAARGEKLLPRFAQRREPSLDAPSDFGVDANPGRLQDFATAVGLASRGPAGPGQSPPPSQRVHIPMEPRLDTSVAGDVETLGMSTLTFQDYVRERMLKRRQAELDQAAVPLPAALTPAQQAAAPMANGPTGAVPLRVVASDRSDASARLHGKDKPRAAAPSTGLNQALINRVGQARRDPPVLRDEIRLAGPGQHDLLHDDAGRTHNAIRERTELMGELRSVRALIDERFGMLAFMERLQRDPRQATLSQKLFDAGLSPALVRKLVQGLPADAPDELAWAAGVLERNVLTNERDLPLEDHDGVFAMIGATGVGKTTSTAKLAAAFATQHGAANLGLVTLDAYRIAAHEQLRTYGRIIGVPVHTAHDRASLEDLLELLSAKKLVLIDTAGMAQRDSRTRELLEMLQHRSIKKLLVINAAAQGETVEDVMVAYGVQRCHGVIVSKLDEAVKLGPALDALIRHKAKVVGVANGQRVPEDWHRLSAQALVQRALRGGGGASWRLDASEVNLMFAATQGAGYPAPQTAQGAAFHA